MFFSNIEYTICYVDPTKTTNGSGVTISDPKNQLPTTDGDWKENTLYLIRRTDENYYVTLPSISVGRHNFVFMGMPKQGDFYWQAVPQQAKDLWGADTAEYANVGNNSNNHWQCNNATNIHFCNVYLMRVSNNRNYYNVYSANSNAPFTTNVSFKNCKFGYKGVDLENQQYSTQVSVYSCMFFYASRLKSFVMKDCLMNFHLHDSGTYYGIYFEDSQIVSISNVEIYNVTQTSYYENYPLYFYGNNNYDNQYYVENVNCHIRFNGSNQYIPSFLKLSNAFFLSFKNIVTDLKQPLGTSTPTTLSLYRKAFKIQGIREYEIDNFVWGIPQLWNIQSDGGALYCSVYHGSNNPGAKMVCKNIFITMEESQGIGTPNYYDRAKSSGGNYAAFYFNAGSSDGNPSKVAILDNINVYNIKGKAAYLSYCQIRNARFHGSICCYYALGDIEEIISDYPAYQLYLNDYSQIRVQRIETNQNNETYPPQQQPVVHPQLWDQDCWCYVDYCNAFLRPTTNTSSGEYGFYSAICGNEIQQGHFSQKSANFVVDTWSVYRQNGAKASLKCWNNFSNTYHVIWLGAQPFGGSKLTPLEVGINYLVVYIAYKGFTAQDNLGNKLIFQANVPNGNGGYDRYFSSCDGMWLNDRNSVWKNDSGLTQKVLVMPLEVKTLEQQIDLKIQFSWYSSSGYVYIDPAFKLYMANEVPNLGEIQG